MNSKEKKPGANAIIPEGKQGLATRSPALISRGLSDLTGSLDSILVEMGKALLLGDQGVGDLAANAIGHMFEKANEVFRSETYSFYYMVSETSDLMWYPPTEDWLQEDFQPVRIKLEEGVAEMGYVNATTKRTGEGLAGWVARTGQLVVVPDTSKDSRFIMEVDGKGTTEAHSLVAAPVRRNDRCLGVIELINCVGPEGFSKRKLALLEAFTDFAATAIENQQYVQMMRESSITDKDSGLRSPGFLGAVLNAEIGRSQRTGSEFSFILIDVNLFLSEIGQSPWKDFREVPVGAWESCVKQVGKALMGRCLRSDNACRYSDTRFALVLPGLAERPGETRERACKVACDLSRQFGEAEWLSSAPTRSNPLAYTGRTFKLPACIGVVSVPKDATTIDELLKLAEETISLVRSSGRGGVAVANVGILQVGDF